MFIRCSSPESSLASNKPRSDFAAYLPEIRSQPNHWFSILSKPDAGDDVVDFATTMLGKTMRACLPFVVGRRTLLTHSDDCRFPEFCDPNLAMARTTRKHALQTLALSLMLRNFDGLERMCEGVGIGDLFVPSIRLDSSPGETGIKYNNRALLGKPYAEELLGPFPLEATNDGAWYCHDAQPIFVHRKAAQPLAEHAVRASCERGATMEMLEPYMAAFGANVPVPGQLAAEN